MIPAASSVDSALGPRTAIAWIWSEFQPRRWLRLLLGSLSLIVCALLAVAVGSLDRMNSNAWYGTGSAKAARNTIAELEAGRSEQLYPRYARCMRISYPTYQGRAHYDELIEQFQRDIEKIT